MKKINILILFCFLCFHGCYCVEAGCYYIETIKNKYADWESLTTAPENLKGWFPPLFKTELSFENKISNIIIYNDVSSIEIWGKFNYSNNFLSDLPMQVNLYNGNVVMDKRQKRIMRRIGFRESKVKLYFYENETLHSRNSVWHYFVDTDKSVVYFCNLKGL